jgi:hypothetical protein
MKHLRAFSIREMAFWLGVAACSGVVLYLPAFPDPAARDPLATLDRSADKAAHAGV